MANKAIKNVPNETDVETLTQHAEAEAELAGTKFLNETDQQVPDLPEPRCDFGDADRPPQAQKDEDGVPVLPNPKLDFSSDKPESRTKQNDKQQQGTDDVPDLPLPKTF